MHSVFRLPWSSEPVGEKFSKHCNGVVEFPFVNKLKRKLADTTDLSTNQSQRRIQPVKRSKPNSPSQKPFVSLHTYREPAKVAPWSAKLVQHPLPVCAPTTLPADGAPAKSSIERSQSTAPKQVHAIQSSVANVTVTNNNISTNVVPPVQISVSEQSSKSLGALPNQAKTPYEDVSVTTSSPSSDSCAKGAQARVEDGSKVNAADRVASMREMIESHFNYEILLKHREVQLIEQELAKCQISLEQLRRCHLIPYPGTLTMSEDVSNGIGPALQAQKSSSRPECPAPWGVTDGPYSRHYSKWLIPDPRFDALSKEEEAAFAKHRRQLTSEGRATRASLGEFPANSSSASSARARLSRTSAGKRPYMNGVESPTSVRDRQLPLVIKRSTDGQYVKLVCSDCHRGNFSSAQGFLNHCRIAHHRDYKSHDAAAVACGQPVERDAVTSITMSSSEQREQTQEAVAQSTSPRLAQQIQPLAQSQMNVTGPPVHPLIHETGLSAADLARSAYKLPPREFGCVDASTQITGSCKVKPDSDESQFFVSAPETPHLSALLQKRKFGGNLQAMVAESREIIDMPAIPESSSSSELEEGSSMRDAPSPSDAASNDTKLSKSEARARRAESSLKTVRFPRDTKLDSSTSAGVYGIAAPGFDTSTPLAGLNSVTSSDQASTSTVSSDMDLSPNTAESSNPGLVSDRDDDYIDDDDLEHEEERVIDGEQSGGLNRNDRLKAGVSGVEVNGESTAIHVACIVGNEHDASDGDFGIDAVKFTTQAK